MRIHAVSASAAVVRTLETLIAASGHTATEIDAELLLIDALHPAPLPETPCAQLSLGSADTGADAISLPIRPQQLARILMARRPVEALALGSGWQLDQAARSLTHASLPAVSLTEKECALLATLALAAPAPLSREALLERVWGITTTDIDTHTLETHIYRIRSKLSALTPAPCDIDTQGSSYCLTGIRA